MVSDFGNTTDFIPLDIVSDPLLAPDTTQSTASNGGGSFTDNAMSNPLDIFGTIGDLINAAEQIVPKVVDLIDNGGIAHPLDTLKIMATYAKNGLQALNIQQFGLFSPGAMATREEELSAMAQGGKKIWDWTTGIAEGAWMSGLLSEGLGLDLTKFDSEGQRGVSTTDSMIGFAIMLQFGILAFVHGGKALFGSRWPEVLGETLAKIPEEMGLSWALGLTIDKAFDAAVGESIGNNIRRQKSPNKPEWPVARTMLKQHVITDDDLDDILSDAGYNSHWKDAIKKLETQPIPVGDIQALYQNGILNNDVALSPNGPGTTVVAKASDLPKTSLDYWLIKLGFSAEALDYIKTIYVTKAETTSGAEIRSVWRGLFQKSLVSETEYRDKLASVNFPQMLIDDDVQAIKDEKTFGWKTQQVSVIKSDYLHHPGTQNTAIQKLQLIGYSHDDATAMVNAWAAPALPRHRGLTAGQILKFYAAGITLNPPAETQLVALGYDTDTAQFLINHPLGTSGARVVHLTPGLVIQAFLDGAIQEQDLKTELGKAGAKDTVLDYYYQTAMYRYARHHVSGSNQQPLAEGDIKEAFKHGIMDFPTALVALESLGFSSTNATIILEIVNKGPITPPPMPAFGSLDAAISFLQFLGVTVEPPIDNTYESAVSMVEQAGYAVIYPPNFVVPRSGQTANVGG